MPQFCEIFVQVSLNFLPSFVLVRKWRFPGQDVWHYSASLLQTGHCCAGTGTVCTPLSQGNTLFNSMWCCVTYVWFFLYLISLCDLGLFNVFLQWDVEDNGVTFPLATMSVVFTFIFVLEVSLIICFFGCYFMCYFDYILIISCFYCFIGDNEADSHVPSRLLAEPTKPVRPPGHIAGRHLDCSALFVTG